MKLFDVYSVYPVTPVKGKDVHVWDEKGTEYLDLYGGHAVISIGHAHPTYVKAIAQQVAQLGFYSNSIVNPLQERLAQRLGEVCGLQDYRLFLCNSGAEANENAIKLASFHTGRKRVLTFCHSFHGRTSIAVAATDNPKIVAPVNMTPNIVFCSLNDKEAVKAELAKGDVAGVIIEGIQGVGGLDSPTADFMKFLREETKKTGTVLILDEIQSGYGRSGKFFAFEHYGILPDIISVAKGIANGFPMGGILIGPDFEARYGMLGTTFGGNHLGCAAALAVLDVIEGEKLIENAAKVGDYAAKLLAKVPHVTEIKGRGLMLGMKFDTSVADMRKSLVFDYRIFTGSASDPNLIRVLPSLTVKQKHIDALYAALTDMLK